ncbi:MAG: peptidase M32 [Bdellovibrionales bacterium GWA2_49_15]|nr:MAG: peptidase M32 [Bdellovibrionales bacterium GWA2_49_15]HAZ12918.1 carboxypeptidase M32 [Bdellovibrionales bacterium]
MSWKKLDQLAQKLESLSHASAMLNVDEACHMPKGGGEKRAEAMATLASMSHAILTSPEVGAWIADAEKETKNSPEQEKQRKIASLREWKLQYLNNSCLPSDFVEKKVEANKKCEQLWRDLRGKNDWTGFLPAFSNVIEIAREEAQRRSEILKLSPYDAMMEQFDSGNRDAWIAPLFAQLKKDLKEIIPQALEKQKEKLAKNPLKKFCTNFPIEKQKALGEALMKMIGFDFNHGRLDTSFHPFCGGVPSDVRITTRYRTDEFLQSLMGVLHETGHALYEQGLPRRSPMHPVDNVQGMGIHESQSLFVEMQLARTGEFWQFARPMVDEFLGLDAIKGWGLDDLLNYVNFVEPGLIRVDADEVTYPMHVILRFEIEKDLIAGKIMGRDIPELWNEKMREFLGLDTRGNYKDGCMQDVHWPSGAFGYFPSYTLGALIAAQLWGKMEKDLPHCRQEIAKGDFKAINLWRKDKIWSQACLWEKSQLIERATGSVLDVRFFKEHLKQRYLN